MVCFDLNNKIKKYTSAEEILDDFYAKRLEYYGIRKVCFCPASCYGFAESDRSTKQQHMVDELTKQYERISNQARFVQMIVAKELTVSGKKKAILETELRNLKFKPYPKTTKAREDGEDADVLEEEEGQAGDFDYLLGMAIWSLTNERVRILRASNPTCQTHNAAPLLTGRENAQRVETKRERARLSAGHEGRRYLEQRPGDLPGRMGGKLGGNIP
jgi:DNA topoisomerase-2